MKIVFLNVWEGKLQSAIAKFIKEQSVDTDIFCFQEFTHGMDGIAKDVLSGYEKVSAYKSIGEEDYFPQAIFVRKNLRVLSFGVLLEKQMECGLAIYVQVPFGKSGLYVCNLHGTSEPGEKLDTPGRLRQSQTLIDYFKEKEVPIIIGGDFNLLPQTKSIRIFEENGYKDLIKDFGIKTTRNHYAWDKYPNSPHYYSDYVFVSPATLTVKEFSVPNNEVSDHLPLILDIESIHPNVL
ncbi:MAG: endonuclease/exonuclease/phosphatase family protein [Candidatus Moranbacteria bacterium]|nr:endonuclease/exonuclease/phosphatase family protein [Candidatus Moranbacteria bacterium]